MMSGFGTVLLPDTAWIRNSFSPALYTVFAFPPYRNHGDQSGFLGKWVPSQVFSCSWLRAMGRQPLGANPKPFNHKIAIARFERTEILESFP
jgi:hypothetical protein